MRIHFSRKEEKEDILDTKSSNFSILYLMAIKNSNPRLWKHLKDIIENIDNDILETSKSKENLNNEVSR